MAKDSMQFSNPAASNNSPASPLAVPLKIPRRAMRRRYECGRCPSYLANIRWERIFQEKSADPTYYTRRTVRQGSALHGFERI